MKRKPIQTYPPKVTEFARRLYADGEGHTINEIRAALAKRGYYPKRDTIRYWVDDAYREDKLRSQRNFRPPGPARRKAWRRRLDRMEELREMVGLSYADIAKLMSHDFNDLELTTEQVSYMLKGKADPRTIRRNLWPRGAKREKQLAGRVA